MQPPPLDEPWRRVVYIHRAAEKSNSANFALRGLSFLNQTTAYQLLSRN